MKKTMLVGIAGGTGSGKTTLAKGIEEALGDDATLLCHDYYYKKNDNLSFEERCKLNYDHPSAIETNLLIEHLKKLKAGNSIRRPIYSFVTHTRLEETVVVEPVAVVILEGILVLENETLRDLMDIKVFVDTDADIRLARRIERDVTERGRSLDSVLHQYLSVVKPMHDLYVEPSKKYADFIIPEGGYNKVALSMIIDRLKSVIYVDENIKK